MFSFLKNLGPTELIIIGVVLVILFGSKRLVELGKGAGETTKEFKKIKKEFGSAIEETKEDLTTEEDDREEVSKE